MKHLESFIFVVAIAILLSLGVGFQADTQEQNPDAATAVAMVPSGIPITDNTPPCIQLYYYIEKYAADYEIPLSYAYGVAYAETHYEGPFDWKYKHSQTSCVGAVGPMQIMPATANLMWPDSSISVSRLKNDIEFNVKTSMKLLRRLRDKYGDWKLVFGAYNTGRPMVNDYAIKVYNYKPDFRKHS